MKSNLLLWVGLIITLPCFAGPSQVKLHFHQNHARRVQLLKNYADVYSAALLTPVSIDQKDHSSWEMIFKPEKFDIIRFATGFDPEGHDAILNFILGQMEEGESSDLIDHPLVVPVWVFWDSKLSFNDWVRAIQNSPQKTGDVKAGSSSAFKVRDRSDDFTSEFYCRNYGPSRKIISSALLLYQSEAEEYAAAAKLPPVPFPVPPPLPRFFSAVVKINGAKLPPVPFPVPPPLPRFSSAVVKINGAKLPPVPFPVPPPLPRFSSAVVKINGAKLPPVPFPVPPPLPRFFSAVVKINGAKLPPVPFPVPPPLPRFSFTSGDINELPLVSWESSSFPLSAWSVISNGEIQGRTTLHPELYFVMVWPGVTPEKRELFRKILKELQFEQEANRNMLVMPNEKNYMEDWHVVGEEECDELESLIETAFIIPAYDGSGFSMPY